MAQLDLTAEYDKLNKLIFQNRLPDGITIKWNHSKKCLGKTKITQSHNKAISFHISISKFFLCTDMEYIETLIHEMIHVQMAIEGNFRKGIRPHGSLFRKYMDQINNQFPQYSIKIREDEKVEIDKSRIALQKGFLLVTDNNKKYFNLYRNEINDRELKLIINHLSSAGHNTTGNLYVFQGKYQELATAPVRNNLKTLVERLQYFHNEEEMENLLELIRKGQHDLYRIEKKKSLFERISKTGR